MANRVTISDIKRLTSVTAPHFFTRDTLKFFGQRMSDFKVYKQKDGTYYVTAPMKDSRGRVMGNTERIFNPADNSLTIPDRNTVSE
jgi:hypothetical protein